MNDTRRDARADARTEVIRDEAVATAHDVMIRLDDLVRALLHVRRLIACQLLVALLTTVGGAAWLQIRGTFRQLDDLTRFNRDFTSITCDSSLYSKDELSRRTGEQRRRLTVLCASRMPARPLVR